MESAALDDPRIDERVLDYVKRHFESDFSPVVPSELESRGDVEIVREFMNGVSFALGGNGAWPDWWVNGFEATRQRIEARSLKV